MVEHEFFKNQKINPIELKRALIDWGYVELTQAGYASFSHKGDRFIIWPVFANTPVVIDFFGNEIEKIKRGGLELLKFKLPENVLKIGTEKVLPGDQVVHINHGIGEFIHFLKREFNKEERVYIELGYADGGRLFLPADREDLLSVYVGIGKTAKLTKLGSGRWQAAKKKVEESVLKLAKELLFIYAKREITRGEKLSWPPEWESHLEKSFPYQLTDDQRKALTDTLSDLRREKPMDRLISGDVGFGKTEVAIRAAAAAVAAGKQVAVLAPTTILVEQHLATFKTRLSSLPVKIRRLSRFASKKEEQQILDQLKAGSVDIVIGTHRLLAKDVEIPRFGLLVIDEEQKFGVKHKEKLKQLRTNVNVLSLSATPIPRTLFMSLSGIRDLSVISAPPKGRKAVETKVATFSLDQAKNYIQAEKERNGQVYYVFNDISMMPTRLRSLRELLPALKIDMVHGQMDEQQLAKVMLDFSAGEIDVLLTSTIIESGLDLPNVNTLIVEKAEQFGLSDLYQLRGRVGRSDRQAFALLFYSQGQLKGQARSRLLAMAEMTELGKGYEVALRDLEIRGGGNILGKEQSGNLETVGLVLYSRLLKQAVDKLKAVKY